MGPIKKTDDQAHVNMHKIHESVLEQVKELGKTWKHEQKNFYQKVLATGDFVGHNTDNTVLRAAGFLPIPLNPLSSYNIKSVLAVLNTFKGVTKAGFSEIKQNEKLGKIGKMGHYADHIIKGSSQEGVVAMAAMFGKAKLLITIGASVAALPALAGVGALIAGPAAVAVAAYFLSTSAGHHLETGVAKTSKFAVGFGIGMVKAMTGNFADIEQKGLEIEETTKATIKSAGEFLKNIRRVMKGEKWVKKPEHGPSHHGKHSSFISDLKNIAAGAKKIAIGAAIVTSAVGAQINKQTPSESKFMKAQTEVAISAMPKSTPSASTYVLTGADIKAAAEKENKVTKAPPTKKPQTPKMGR
jgi:hypothetical protein